MKYSIINFKNENDKKTIIKLAKRNDFHTGDIMIAIKSDIEAILNECPDISKYPVFIQEELKMNLILKMKKNDEEYLYNGMFIKNELNNIIGFIIHKLERKTNNYIIDFLLVDKNYRNKGYGKYIVKQFLSFVPNERVVILYVKTKDENMRTNFLFYVKLGFLISPVQTEENYTTFYKKIKK